MDSFNNPLKELIDTLRNQVRDYQIRIAKMECDFENRSRKLMVDTQNRIENIIQEKDAEISSLKVKIQSQLSSPNNEAENKKEKEDDLTLKCPDFIEYSKNALDFLRIVEKSFLLLDKFIFPYFEDDEANYFYVRRRLKFLEAASTSLGDMREKWLSELNLLSKYGIVMVGSELYKVLGGKSNQPLDVLKYYLYNALFQKIAGPTLILLKEMEAVSTYVELEEEVNVVEFVEMEATAHDLLEKMGYSLVDVKLFAPLEMSEEIDCVERSEVELPNVASGDVYEIVKLAVNYGTTQEHSEVKVKN